MSKRTAILFGSFTAILLALATVSFLSFGHGCVHFYRRLFRSVLAQPYYPGPDVTFKWEMAGSGTTTDGARFDDSEYLSSDCVKVSVIIYSFESAKSAQNRVNNTLTTARRVSEKDVTQPPVSAPAEERVVLYETMARKYDILRRNGNRLVQIESQSLNHALAYEKRLAAATR